MIAIRVVDAQPIKCSGCGRRDIILTLSCGHAKVVAGETAVAETVSAAMEWWSEAVTACPRGCTGVPMRDVDHEIPFYTASPVEWEDGRLAKLLGTDADEIAWCPS